MDPRISVLLPVFNGERFLRESIESVLGQSYTDFELIVVDDGSTDGTAAILSEYSKDQRLRVIKLVHAGICNALNAGLRAARGEFIARMDADDVMMPERLERQFAYLAQHPELGGTGSYYFILNELGKICGANEMPPRSLNELRIFLSQGGRLIYPHPTTMFRRAVALSLGGYREQYEKCEDVDLFLRMFEAGQPLLIQPEYLLKFRYHPGSVSAKNTKLQYHLTELIFHNYLKRQSGHTELTLQQYFDGLHQTPFWNRLAVEGAVKAKALLRRRDVAQLQGKRWASAAYLIRAAALNPSAIVRKFNRAVLSFLSPTDM